MFRKIYIFVPLFFLLISGASAASFGLETPIWQHMWKHGMQQNDFYKLNSHRKLQWDVSAENLTIYKNMGATWNVVVVRQKLGESPDWKRLHEIVKEHKKQGIDVFFRLIEDPRVYGKFLSVPNHTYGYNNDYYVWVRSIVSEFYPNVSYYLIGNEVDNNLGFNLGNHKKIFININDYKKLVLTARKAIKSINTSAKIVDHGVSSVALGLAVANDLYNEYGVDSAAKFWSDFHFKRISFLYSKYSIKRLLSSESASRKVQTANATYRLCHLYDAVQLHYYFSPDTLPTIVDWINSKLSQSSCNLPIIATEIGYRMNYKKEVTKERRERNVADWGKYSPDDHAASLVKDFTVLLSKGIDKILYWQLRFHNDKNPNATLYKSTGRPNEFVIEPAGVAYRFFTKQMRGMKFNDSKIINNKNIIEYSFSSKMKISIAWSASKSSINLPANLLTKISFVYNMYGKIIHISNHGSLVLSNRPIYIFWKY